MQQKCCTTDIMPRKPVVPEQIFYDHIYNLISDLLITNVNYRNSYYHDKSILDFKNDTMERARYVLTQMDSTKHLIIPEETHEEQELPKSQNSMD